MAFKRALWHSGLNYRQTCTTCHSIVNYTDYSLDFRPWYPNGFVYCPKCRTPLRHNENYAVNPDGTPVYNQSVAAATGGNEINENVAYCSKCGKSYLKGQGKFCTKCGSPLPQE